jgi:NAD(P)H-hydrate epimerase
VAASSIDARVIEVMTARIDHARLAESLDEVLAHAQVAVVGPGLGLGDEARAVVDHLLGWPGPIVVDADALSLNAGRPGALARAKKAIVTPHPGEAGRLLGKTPAQVERDRFGAARELAAATGAVVVLKGAHTIVASPDSRVVVSPVSCPALATAGAGDVLSGIVAAMACTLAPFEAACAGVMLHALAGQAWSAARGGLDRGMLASDIADSLELPGRAARETMARE